MDPTLPKAGIFGLLWPSPRTPVARASAALPYLVVFVVFLVVSSGYVSGDQRVTPSVRAASAWILYEVLAVLYSMALPLAILASAVLRQLPGVSKAVASSPWVGSLALVVPFLLLAWAFTPAGAMGPLVLVQFGAFAGAKVISYRARRPRFREGLSRLGRCMVQGIWMWTGVTAAFLLSAFVVLPIDALLDIEWRSHEHSQRFMLMGMGALYFLLMAVAELLPVGRWIHGRGDPTAPA